MTDKGFVVWITGLPSSGKTTIARKLQEHMRKEGKRVELLDGDEVRRWLSPEAGFSREDRERHLRRVAYVSKLLARNNVAVLASFVSPYKNVREAARKTIEGEGLRFIEVYVKCSIEECMRRDIKGLYKKALKGEIGDMTGIQDPYEEPSNPEVIVDTEKEDPEECVKKILRKLGELNLI
ncbi:adenylyl-sulfate kinase [Candidatus Bathyarchaeota archaeon]|nr:adenylyl-sulfate kinase [Candidatus Bathyarchaeota archaeon]